jgi:hypothetical protein
VHTTTTEGEILFSPSLSVDSNPLNVQDLWKKLMDKILAVLQRRFSDDVKRRVKPFNDRISFACPYCGDSSHDSAKKRGNIFVDSMNYHCFNGDCNAHKSLYQFLKDHGELDSLSVEEIAYIKQKISQNNHAHVAKIQVYQDVESLISQEAMNLTVSREFFMKVMKLQEIKGSRIERYLRQRHQTKFENFGFDPRKGQIYVFNLSKDSTRILGFQIKTFSKRSPYLTYKTSRMRKELGIFKQEQEELLNKIDTISTSFGIMHLDLSRTVTIFEGPLDSFLFPNGVGVCSAKNDFPLETDMRYFYDNDSTGREWSLRRLDEGYSVFLWKKYIQENELSSYVDKIKDLNDLIIEIKRNQWKVKKFADYFSCDKYDAYWI